MSSLRYIIFGDYSDELRDMTNFSIKAEDEIIFVKEDSFIDHDLCNKISGKIIFVMELNSVGVNFKALKFLEFLSENYKYDRFKDVTAAMFVRSSSELYTKSFSRKFIFMCNRLGMAFIGQSLIEATGSFKNYLTWQKTIKKTTYEIALDMCLRQAERLRDHRDIIYDDPSILVLHASNSEHSNTIMLWQKVKLDLVKKAKKDLNIDELHVDDGTILDCKGCDFKTCLHYAKTRSCFYGGPMVKEILPKVERADIIVLIAPNYNDSISAKLMAIVNRLTVLYRIMSFNRKKIYSVIVSGNSGSDCVSMQIIDALNINKGFYLPPNFSIMETANDPGMILNVENLDEKIDKFTRSIIDDNFSL